MKRINDVFPHWFCGNFKQFNDDPSKLPFDQNCLVAICAPRPVLFSNAKEDTWANPDGQFEVLKAADPVYRFLGAEGLDAKERPPIGKLLESKLGYFIREGKHEDEQGRLASVSGLRRQTAGKTMIHRLPLCGERLVLPLRG